MKTVILILAGASLSGLSAGLTSAYYENAHKGWIDPVGYKLTVGPKDVPQCQTEVHLSSWKMLNDMELWRWTTLCVEHADKANEGEGKL